MAGVVGLAVALPPLRLREEEREALPREEPSGSCCEALVGERRGSVPVLALAVADDEEEEGLVVNGEEDRGR